MEKRFMSHVIKASGCWKWAGYHRADGYITFSIGSKKHRAHRIAYEIFVGEIPEGLEIDHICKNRGCVNPEHLRAVTHLQNMQNIDPYDNHQDKDHNFTPYNWKQGKVCRICYLTKQRVRRGVTSPRVVLA
jgi:hypothetical protein